MATRRAQYRRECDPLGPFLSNRPQKRRGNEEAQLEGGRFHREIACRRGCASDAREKDDVGTRATHVCDEVPRNARIVRKTRDASVQEREKKLPSWPR